MEESFHQENEFAISGMVSLAEASDRVLKHSETFLITDRHGDIRPLGFEQHGLFHQETRFLSRCTLRFEGKSPPLLSSAVEQENYLLSVDLTNPGFRAHGGNFIGSGQIHINRSIFLWEGCCYVHIRVRNYALQTIDFSLSLEFEADFADVFELRGMKRKARGEILPPIVEDGQVIQAYKGLDGILRKSRITFSPVPAELTSNGSHSQVKLGPHQSEDFYFTVSCDIQEDAARIKVFDQALQEVRKWYLRLEEDTGFVETSNEQFDEMVNRAKTDLNMMITETGQGLFPYAGIPWFSTVFGRDGLITALQTLWWNPGIARGVLSHLASTQAMDLNREKDAQPGKILHEERKGEMAATGEVPFGRYYGTIDATPLFIVLAGYYYERTGDLDFIRQLWPSIERALQWIDAFGDSDGDGFVEYSRESTGGLSNQGWKDSRDSVFHADGALAEPPIALCEVQGYVYDAKLKAGRMAAALEKGEGQTLLREAADLREKFLRTFWCPELGVYALALDGKKRPCRVKTSNAGHCLFSGIGPEEHARILVQNFLRDDFFSGWGIRTVASSEVRYNPMSYHNGSVWPHDNALIAFGMGRYRFKEAAARILAGLFQASLFFDLRRPPELFCGFDRSRGEGPTLYPVACHPQAWASGAVFLMLQACLGLSIQAAEDKVFFHYPYLPPFLPRVKIRNLRVGTGLLDVEVIRGNGGVAINILRREGPLEVITMK